ncbi:hypothetical protein MROS_1392 [Melioribacter roseus P3M-2]|uniref:Transporter n=1 Tax=Melioribacter roseus (strain DSM 23840 / JCM 17771 / VKM B-2668 / P3M-2) TaxID=1191523 RepID=I6ZRD3_MELRP|nr:hypothetical protein [Melioribacter roseus]AFN74629.1 hypothetical protein MROS_1392 [Melioribacter roseus P3M-2]
MKIHFLIASLFLFVSTYSYGQGCSDAGVCTINGLKPHGQESANSINNQFKIGGFFGVADNSVNVYGNYLEYNGRVTGKYGVDIKITSIAQSGNDISKRGLSDVFLNLNYFAADRFVITAGAKIPLSDANRKLDGLSLPMDYQPTLGTLDLIMGAAYAINNFQIVAAIQQPLSQNGNEFISGDYPANSPLRNFQTTNKFKRSGDVLLRVSYPIRLYRDLTITPSILPIYHLANDKYTDEYEIENEIIGSRGLTLNGNIYLDYKLNEENSVQLNVGAPFIVRDSRPDGLTRSFIATLEYKITF